MADHYALSRSAELTSLAAFRGLIDAACGEHPEDGNHLTFVKLLGAC